MIDCAPENPVLAEIAAMQAKLQALFLAAVSPAKIEALANSLVDQAIAGNMTAAKLVVPYFLGKPAARPKPVAPEEKPTPVAPAEEPTPDEALEKADEPEVVEVFRFVADDSRSLNSPGEPVSCGRFPSDTSCVAGLPSG